MPAAHERGENVLKPLNDRYKKNEKFYTDFKNTNLP
jgi:hypothetical protein